MTGYGLLPSASFFLAAYRMPVLPLLLRLLLLLLLLFLRGAYLHILNSSTRVFTCGEFGWVRFLVVGFL